MKVLFLGGTGNISTACVLRAVAEGHEVAVLTRGLRACPFDNRVTLHKGERDDARRLLEIATETRYDAVVDFLGYRPEQVEAARSAFSGRAGHFVFISTAAVYARHAAPYVLTEETPRGNPYWEYGRAKIACEDLLLRAHREHGFPATLVRPSYTYGESWIPSGFGGQDYTVVDRMRRGHPIVCHGDGTGLWTMTASADFAKGLVGLLGHPQALGEAFHITSDEVLTWRAVYEAMARAASCEVELVHVPSALIARFFPERGGSLLGDKAWSVVFDNAKVKRFVPAYVASIPFAEGIARSIAWYDADPARRVVSAETNARLDRVIAAQRRAFED